MGRKGPRTDAQRARELYLWHVRQKYKPQKRTKQQKQGYTDGVHLRYRDDFDPTKSRKYKPTHSATKLRLKCKTPILHDVSLCACPPPTINIPPDKQIPYTVIENPTPIGIRVPATANFEKTLECQQLLADQAAAREAGLLPRVEGGPELRAPRYPVDQPIPYFPVEQVLEIRQLAQNTLAKRYLRHFVRQAWVHLHPNTPLEWGKHVDALCDHIQNQLEDRWKAQEDPNFTMRAQNVLINVPPRTLKSTILALSCLWAWLYEPTLRIAAFSANPQVSIQNARICHTIIQCPWYLQLPGAPNLSKIHSALTDFGNDQGGTRFCRGLDSNVTGVGADWLQIDDPHDVRDSESQIRQTVDGYDMAVHNRINNPRTSIRTGIMQRFRVDDFSGHMLEIHTGNPAKGGWLHLRMPMEYLVNHTCKCGSCVGTNVYGWQDWRTVEGEILHVRFTTEYLDTMKIVHGPYGYAGQYQQEPAPPTGGMIKNVWYGWFRLVNEHPPVSWQRPAGCNESETVILERRKNGKLDLDMIVISVDGTFGNTSDTKGSAVGLQAWGLQRMRRFCLDDRTAPISYIDTIVEIKAMVKEWGHEAPIRILVEPKAFGPTAVEELRVAMREGKFTDKNGRPVYVVVEVLKGPDDKGVAGDKETRAHAATPALASGMVLLRQGSTWATALVHETGVFPNGKRDDRVDAMTQVLNFYTETNDIAKARALLQC